jgi:hypothetical protein
VVVASPNERRSCRRFEYSRHERCLSVCDLVDHPSRQSSRNEKGNSGNFRES